MLTPQHDRFCRELHRRITETGGKIGIARTAAYIAVYGEGTSARDNARKLANKPHIKARLAALSEDASKLTLLDSGWALLQLGQRVADYNIDDYLTRAGGQRYFDIDNCTREQLGRLSELSMEEEIVDAGEETMVRVRKIKIKPYDPSAVIGLMAKIAGWEAPKKIAPTDADGKTLTLEALVGASMVLGNAA